MKEAVFISVEGLDGSGKNTIAAYIAQWLRTHAVTVEVLEEKTHTALTRDIDFILSRPYPLEMSPITQMLLTFAARQDFVDHTLIPRLEKGCTVITTKFSDTSFATWKLDNPHIPLPFTTKLDEIVTYEIQPNLTFLLDVDPLIALGRVSEELVTDTMVTRFTELRAAYLELAAKNLGRIVVIDANQPIEQVYAQLEGELLGAVNHINRRPASTQE